MRTERAQSQACVLCCWVYGHGPRTEGTLTPFPGASQFRGKKEKSTKAGTWWHRRVRVSTDVGEESALRASQRHTGRLAGVTLVQPGGHGTADHIPSRVKRAVGWGRVPGSIASLLLLSKLAANSCTQRQSQKSQMLSDLQALTGRREIGADTLPRVLPPCHAPNFRGLPLRSLTTLLQEMTLNTVW